MCVDIRMVVIGVKATKNAAMNTSALPLSSRCPNDPFTNAGSRKLHPQKHYEEAEAQKGAQRLSQHSSL
jgi:hypothetical protein